MIDSAASRWRPLIALALTTPLVLCALVSNLAWSARPFPGFFVLCNNVVPTIGLYDWTGMQAAVPFHSQVVAADDHPLRTSADFYAYAASLPMGTPVRYTLAKDAQTFTRTVSTMPFGIRDYWLTVGMWLGNGILLVGLGIAVSLLRPGNRAARAFMIFGVVTGSCALTGSALYHPDFCWISSLHLVTQALLPATFIHFGFVFSEEHSLMRRHPAWLAAPYMLSAVLAIWAIAGFYGSPPRMTALYVAYRYSALSAGLWFGLVVIAYWRNRTPTVRARLRPVLLGWIVGTAIMFVGFLNISAHGGDFPLNLIGLTPPLFYLSVAYAIVKHDLFDIDAFIKQTVAYLTLTLGISAAYAVSVAVLSRFLSPDAVRASLVFNIAFVVFVASVFHPLRLRVQNGIDRTFYRSRLDYRRTITDVSAALTSLLNLDEILERLGRTLVDGLQTRSLAVLLWGDQGTQIWRYGVPVARMVQEDAPSVSALHDRLAAAPRRPLALADVETDLGSAADSDDGAAIRVRAEMLALDAVLVVPLALGEAVIGGFALGPRRSGSHFTGDDLALLDTLAAESAVAIQNARSYRALEALNADLESKVHARTAELENSNAELGRAYETLQAAQTQLLTTEKMASLGLVVAGVAHEINNPLAFIIGNVEPLHQTLAHLRAFAADHRDRGLTAEVERLTKILDLMALGAERTASIVRDLRTFSRLGEAQPLASDLHEAIEVSLRLLLPSWADRITIHREYGALTPVEVIPGQINQVFMNVLANACDAIRGRGNLWIRTARENANVVVAIRDDGPGIPAEYVGRIFDPFFTTKPVGKGTGLGLAITHGIVSQHGGTIRVTTEPGKGTEFQIVLPDSNSVSRSRSA